MYRTQSAQFPILCPLNNGLMIRRRGIMIHRTIVSCGSSSHGEREKVGTGDTILYNGFHGIRCGDN